MIIVFGSNILDIFFNVADLPPRDTALHLDEHFAQPGGKGANQAIAAARAGSDVHFYGALGKGGHGRQMYKNLATNQVDVSGVEFLDTSSGLATIFVDEKDGSHKIIVSQGANLKAKQDKITDKLLTKETTLLVQGELSMEETGKLIARVKEQGGRTIMNLAPVAPISEEILKNLDFLILNIHEAEGLAAQLDVCEKDHREFAQYLYDTFAVAAIITLGERGAITYGVDGFTSISTLKIDPVDMLGAGDTFCGYLAAGLDQGKSLYDSLKQASVAGALTCTKMGAQTSMPYAPDINSYIGDIEVKKAA